MNDSTKLAVEASKNKKVRLKPRKTRRARVCPCGTEIAKGDTFYSYPEKGKEAEIIVSTCSEECMRKWHKLERGEVDSFETPPEEYFERAFGTDPWDDRKGEIEFCKKHVCELVKLIAGPHDQSWIDQKMVEAWGYNPFDCMESVMLQKEHAVQLVKVVATDKKETVSRDEPASVVHEGDGVLRDAKPDDAHHKYGPSSLAYREACAGWKNRGGTSEAAERGTICHAACEMHSNFYSFPTKFELDGKQVELDQFEQAHVTDALTGVRKLINHTMKGMESPAYEVELEQKLSILDGQTFGTADIVFHFYEAKTLLVVDYKFGIHEVAPASVNPQGIAYALGALELHPDVERVRVAFIQPKLDQLDFHDFTAKELRNEHATRIKTILSRAAAYDAGEIPGDELLPNDGCQYCARVGTCPAVASSALTVAKKLEVPDLTDPSALTEPEHFKAALELAHVLEKWVPAVRSAAKERVLDFGIEIPGYQIVHRKVPRSFDNVVGVAEIACNEFGVDRDDFIGACKVGVGAVQKLVKDAADKGDKQNALGEFESRLVADELVSGGDQTVPQLRRNNKKNENKEN